MTLEEATQKANELNIMFMETSAKAGHNVKSLFKKIAMSLPGMEKEGQSSDAQNTSMFLLRFYPFPSIALTFQQKLTSLSQTQMRSRRLRNANADWPLSLFPYMHACYNVCVIIDHVT